MLLSSNWQFWYIHNKFWLKADNRKVLDMRTYISVYVLKA